MSKKIRTQEVEDLFEAILKLENKEECFQFFEDICTTNEILSFAQRFQVARMLEGIPCRGNTSCPDQLAKAIRAYHE